MDKLLLSLRKNIIFALFLILSPGFWRVVLQTPQFFKEWFKFPFYVNQKLTLIVTEEKLVAIGLMRWAEIDNTGWLALFSKLIYNRAVIFLDEIFNFLSYFSPRIYFQAGDGSVFSPPGIEPVPIILFPLFLYGLISSIEQRDKKLHIGLICFGFLAYLSGAKNFTFLLPILLYYVWLSAKGFAILNKKYRRVFIFLTIIYGIFLAGRSIWL